MKRRSGNDERREGRIEASVGEEPGADRRGEEHRHPPSEHRERLRDEIARGRAIRSPVDTGGGGHPDDCTARSGRRQWAIAASTSEAWRSGGNTGYQTRSMRPSRWSQLSRASRTCPAMVRVGSRSASVSDACRVAQHREGQVQPLGELALVGGLLRAQSEEAHAVLAELRGEVPEGAGLGSAAPRSGDEVPVRGERRLARLAGPRIGEHHRAAPDGRQVDLLTRGGLERDGGNVRAGEVPRPPVVHRDGEGPAGGSDRSEQ